MRYCAEMGIDIQLNGTLIRKLRMIKGVSQENMAADLCLTQSQVCKIESDPNYNPKLSTLYVLANYFNIKIDNLYTVTKASTSKPGQP